ncbi:hypothetical protein AWB67_06181 [Caballeronia terrestris]|jgi:hypothetical protein|uniref:Uncharacterized protein n=1 Tax=Caballeronia terrestris TaxID=1226301 RepID=A0A158KNI6_9BURK|nr:hypothetical protein [Caballeronia terrestris]SAL82644.1 hypothetical protein AWB67_06181 [Caballeronia terrestris]
MQDHLQPLGSNEIEVIDEDLGRAAAGTQTRTGMVAEVCLGRKDSVAAREVSRFARNSREWQQLGDVAAWLTRCSSIRKPCRLHDKATTVCCSG